MFKDRFLIAQKFTDSNIKSKLGALSNAVECFHKQNVSRMFHVLLEDTIIRFIPMVTPTDL